MNRWSSFSVALCLLLAAPPELSAQFKPGVIWGNPYAPPVRESPNDPRVRRANREKAVALLGTPNARDFVESGGEDAVAAVFACSKPVSLKLAEFHASGGLDKLPRPRDLLRVIAEPKHHDDVALWAILHADELMDRDSFDAYLVNPLPYALGLERLASGAAETRSNRLNQAVATTAAAASTPAVKLPLDDNLAIAGGLGILFIIVLLLKRRKQSSFN